MTSMNTQENIFRKVQPGQSSTVHLANTKCFHNHLKSLLFSIVIFHREEARSETLFFILEKVKWFGFGVFF